MKDFDDMRKRIAVLFALCLIGNLALTSCGISTLGDSSQSDTQASAELTQEQEQKESTGSEYVMENTQAEHTLNATGVELSEKKLEMYPTQTHTLTAKITPETATSNNKIVWKSSNSNVATVVSGKVTAKSNGITQISATLPDGRTATCIITVRDKSLADIYESISTDISITLSTLKTATAGISTSNAKLNYNAYQTINSASSAISRISKGCYGYNSFENSTYKAKLDKFYEELTSAKESLKQAYDENNKTYQSAALEAKQHLQKAQSLLGEVEKGLKNSR